MMTFSDKSHLRFKKIFPMPNFTLRIDVDERVTISVDMPKSRSGSSRSQHENGPRAKSKISTTILSNLDEETLNLEVAVSLALGVI